MLDVMKEGWVLSFAIVETAGKDAVSSSPKVPAPDLAPDAASSNDLARTGVPVALNTTSRVVDRHVRSTAKLMYVRLVKRCVVEDSNTCMQHPITIGMYGPVKASKTIHQI
jgi:hypothetical protein